jgi:hypothetical protein
MRLSFVRQLLKSAAIQRSAVAPGAFTVRLLCPECKGGATKRVNRPPLWNAVSNRGLISETGRGVVKE